MRRRHVWKVTSRLPDDVASLLTREGEHVEAPSAEVEARVWTRVAATVGLPPPGGGGEPGDGGGPAAGGDGTSPGGPPLGEVATVAAGAQVTSWLAGPVAKVVAVAALIGAGGVGGVAVDRAMTPPRVVVVSVPVARDANAPAPAAPSAAASAVTAAPADVVASEAAPVGVVATAAPSSSTPPTRDRDLAAERAILERARAALGRGDAASALGALDEHASTFPRGRLGEEREALGVQALLAAGRRPEAEARFARLRSRSPASLFVPVIEAMLEGG